MRDPWSPECNKTLFMLHVAINNSMTIQPLVDQKLKRFLKMLLEIRVPVWSSFGSYQRVLLKHADQLEQRIVDDPEVLVLLKHAYKLEQRIVDDPEVLAKATHTSFVYSTY